MRSTSNEALLGWLEGINAVELSPDGQRFAVAGNASIGALYDADTSLVAELEHFDSVGAVAFCPDGTLLATGSVDMGARLWTRDGELVAVLSGHFNRVDGLAWSHDGALLATASRDGSVRVWAIGSDEPIERWSATGLDATPHVIAWLGDALVVGSDGAIEVRDRNGAERGRVKTGFVRRVYSSADGAHVAAAHHVWDGQTRVDTVTAWDGELRELWSGPGSVCAFGNGGQLAVADGAELTVYDLADGQRRWATPCHGGPVQCVAARAGGTWVTGASDGVARALDADGVVTGIVRHDSAVQFCSVSGAAVLTATNAGATVLWTDADMSPPPPPRPERVPVARFELGAQCNSVAFGPDGEHFAVSSKSAVEIRRIHDGQLARRLECDEDTWAVEWDGELVSARLQDSDGRRVWRGDTGEHIIDLPDAHHYERHGALALVGSDPLAVYLVSGSPPAFELLATYDATAYSAVASPAENRVFIGAEDGGVVLDCATGEATPLPETGPGKAAFSGDGARLVTAGNDGVRLWTLDDLSAQRRLDVAPVWNIVWSPKGDRLVIATAAQQTVLLRADGARIGARGGRLDGAVNPTFSPDGEILATGGRGSPARLWRARDFEPIADLGGLATNHISVVSVAGGQRWLTRANVTPAGDLTLKLWSRDGAPIASMAGHAGKSFWRVNVSPCSSWIASAVWGDRPRVWSALDGSLWGILDGHLSEVRVAEFAPSTDDGRVRIVTACDGGVLAVWDVGQLGS